MQIIPADPTGFGLNFLGSMDAASGTDASSDFAQAMQSAIGSVESGQNFSVNSALQEDSEQSRPLVEGPYSRNTTDGVTYTLDEVCFTKQELQELRKQLIKAGVSAESLQQFDVLAAQPDGALLAQVMVSLIGKGAAVDISDEDAQTITTLLGKIDPTGDLAIEALQRMGEGKGEAALALISNAFARLEPGENIEISRDEALALGRGLGLNSRSLQSISDSFGAYDNLRVTTEQFGNLMGPASAQFTAAKADLQKLNAALEQTLKPIIGKARERMEKEKAASALQDRKVQQSRIMIDNTVQEASREVLSQTLRSGQRAGTPDNGDINAQSDAVSRKLNGRQSGVAGEAGGSRKSGTSITSSKTNKADGATVGRAGGMEQRDAQSDKARVLTEAEAVATRADAEEGSKSRFSAPDFENNSGQSKGKEWSELLNKVETRATPSQSNNAGSIVFSMLRGGQNISETSPLQDTALPSRPPAAQVARQVESGLLSALRDGGSRLDLQLHPQELGAITLTLTARNGEVSARIRSEKSETAEMVTRQLDAIRANLEQQGVKVDKIEVQIQNQQGDDGRLWQNLDQHNSWQEEDARREELARLKNLATMRNSSKNREADVLAQPVQFSGQTARYATQSLHVVA
ncbi:flagellar hook-length control protein FliK [Desulfovibrio sp. SGI.169]|uniref:flagellar hook-length control protein FliK n=1 Tax=Desulfovibrio sp. SGI.169 TaxID=3420561 RepID=UPI003CFD1BFE